MNANDVRLREHTDFKTDVYAYGPIGEKALKERITKSGKTYFDVSNIPAYRQYDIDIIQTSDDEIEKDEYLISLQNDIPLKNLGAVSYEVKTDTYGIKSRNIVWEMISNSNPGCLARCMADYLYYVFLDKDNNIAEEYLMKMKTVRKWLMKNFENINKCDYLKAKTMLRGKDNTGILLINIDHLVENKIAVKMER